MSELIADLTTLADGAIAETFNQEFFNVLKNIVDPNTDPTAVREIKLVVKIKPSPDRSVAGVTALCTTKLAPMTPTESSLLIGFNPGSGLVVATERLAKQQTLFENQHANR